MVLISVWMWSIILEAISDTTIMTPCHFLSHCDSFEDWVPVDESHWHSIFNSPFHEISASWRKCILLPSAVKHSIQHGGVAWSRIRVALIWGSAQNLCLAISVIMVVLSIQRSYITDGNHTFIIPDYFSYQMHAKNWPIFQSQFIFGLPAVSHGYWMVNGCYRAIWRNTSKWFCNALIATSWTFVDIG